MWRYRFLVLAMIGMLFPSDQLLAEYRSELISETVATRHGLTRSWHAQVQLDLGRSRVRHIVLDRGTLFVQTNQAMLQAIDAETGQTLWMVQIGQRNHPSLAPSANGKVVASINGSTLYVVNRFTGKLLWKSRIDGAPGAGAELSDWRAYVILTDGQMLAYRLEEERHVSEGQEVDREAMPEGEKARKLREDFHLKQEQDPPLSCQSWGRALVQPLVTRQNAGEEFVAWSTDRGYLFVGSINRKTETELAIEYKLTTEAGIAARPSYLESNPNVPGDPGLIFIPSRDGFVHALNDKDGSAQWRFSTGEPILERVAVIGANVYVSTQPGGMYSLSSMTGTQQWWTPQVIQFIAASKERIYALDKLGRMLVLDARTGSRLDALDITSHPIRLMNLQTDRIYLASETGLIQCLHEIEQVEPLDHLQPLDPTAPARE
jgi:outer membrane protein assembly factor BamB